MAITVNCDKPQHGDIDLDNLKLRLALEGFEITAPVHGNLIRVSHATRGATHFNSWGTLLDHCNENWKTTYWGPHLYDLASYNG